jgi:hypothetical protein
MGIEIEIKSNHLYIKSREMLYAKNKCLKIGAENGMPAVPKNFRPVMML